MLRQIKSEIKTINGGKKLFHEKDYGRIRVNTDDDVPLNEPLKFPTLTIIRCVFQNGEELDPLIYLDECLYESVQMLEYNRIDILEGIDINKTNKSKKCMLCHYWHFLDKNFSYGPYLCNSCYNIMQKFMDFKNNAIVYVKGSAYRIHFWYMSKCKGISLINNSNLIEKMGIL